MATRRVNLPTADDLFRPTSTKTPAKGARSKAEDETGSKETKDANGIVSGRVRHDEKMTVYVTSDELLDLEHARLEMRREHGVVVDRGRLVREALAIVLADFNTAGANSALVRRLSEE